MIKSINTSSDLLYATGSRPYINPPAAGTQVPVNPVSGDMYYDFSMQEMRVYNGYQWYTIEGQADVGVTGRLERVVWWAERKMQEEAALDELCKKYPALAEAREQFEMVKALVKNHE